jgi:hypothetical protein
VVFLPPLLFAVPLPVEPAILQNVGDLSVTENHYLKPPWEGKKKTSESFSEVE